MKIWTITAGCVPLALMLSGCGGTYSGMGSGSSQSSRSSGSYASLQDFFDKTVEPSMGYCRACHVPGGVGDVSGGSGFMLSSNASQDLANLQASWSTLGGANSNPSPVLAYPSGQSATSHSGGAPWPQSSPIYADVSIVLQCFSLSTDQCMSLIGSGGSSVPDQLPLLDTSDIRSPLAAGCANQPDDAPMPVDPRSLVVPTLNTSTTAVRFNAFWVDVHQPPSPWKQNPYQRATTCGEWRQQVANGDHLLHETDTFSINLADATMYNRLWKAWNLTSRPADFDAEVMNRYGMAASKVHNPYPLPGEDPASTNGGSGELPLGLMQGRDSQGNYNGSIGFTCSACHESQIGTTADGLGTTYGRGNDNEDLVVLLRDLAQVSDYKNSSDILPVVFSAIPIPLMGTSRGATEATEAAEVLAMIRDPNSLDIEFNKAGVHPFHTSSGRNDPPMWWNFSHRARELVDGSFTTDNVRSELLLEAGDLSKPQGSQIKALEAPGEDVHAYMDSLSPPKYPGTYNTQLAETGAILFHTKDLWANGANSNIPRPPGNGSCASCHGVYSPRFTDSTMLPDPRLLGIAATIVPLETIGTDSIRATMVAPGGDGLRAQWDTTWFAYSDLNPDWTPDSYTTQGLATWTTDVGYLAPPLYGVWASAPYFHNGSVPTVWAVLKSSDRPVVWRRQLTAPGSSGVSRGFDMTLDAYDLQKLGWKFDVLNCDGSVSSSGTTTAGANPPSLWNCHAGLSGADILLAEFGLIGGQYVWMSDLYLPPINEQQVEDRMIYNSFMYSYGNGGHLFTDVLTDDERNAVIEYLKTL